MRFSIVHKVIYSIKRLTNVVTFLHLIDIIRIGNIIN